MADNRFSISLRANQGASQTNTARKSGISRGLGVGGRDPNDVIPDKYRGTTAWMDNVLTFPPDRPPITFNMIEGEITNRTSNGLGSIKTIGTYQLPMPLSMTDPQRTGFNDSYSYLNAGINALTGGVGGGAQVAGQFGGGIAALGNALGLTINHMRGVTMEQPLFKQHQFSWKLSANSQEESVLIARIIRKFRLGMAPKVTKLERGVLEYPNVFIPYFSPNMQFLYKFKPCVMSAFDVDYLGGNEAPSFYSGTGAPESIQITMSLLEIEYWLDEDIKVDLDGNGIMTDDPFRPFNWYSVNGYRNSEDRQQLNANSAVDNFRNAIGAIQDIGRNAGAVFNQNFNPPGG